MTKLNHRKHQKTGQHTYRTIKNEITLDIKRSHTNYQNKLFDIEGHVSKNFWEYIKNLWKDCVGVSPLKLNGKVLVDGAEKADALNSQFYSLFTNEDLTNLPPADSEPFISMSYISFSIGGIANLLQSLDASKSRNTSNLFLKNVH